METSKEWEFLNTQIKLVKADGKSKFDGKIWNMYRFEYLKSMAKKHGYELILTKRTVEDVNYFEVKI